MFRTELRVYAHFDLCDHFDLCSLWSLIIWSLWSLWFLWSLWSLIKVISVITLIFVISAHFDLWSLGRFDLSVLMWSLCCALASAHLLGSWCSTGRVLCHGSGQTCGLPEACELWWDERYTTLSYFHLYSILKLSSYFYEDGLVVYAFTNTLDLSSLTSPYMVLPPAKRLWPVL